LTRKDPSTPHPVLSRRGRGGFFSLLHMMDLQRLATQRPLSLAGEGQGEGSMTLSAKNWF